jgi:GT2 family glycosyltransferase
MAELQSSPGAISIAGAPAAGAPGAEAMLVSWLAADVLLVLAELEGEPEVSFIADGEPVEAVVRRLNPSSEESVGPSGAVLTVWVSRPLSSEALELKVRSGKDEISVGPTVASALGVDLRTAIREGLAGQGSKERAETLAFLTAAAVEHDGTLDPLGLSKSLFALREALRDPYPRVELHPDQPQALHVGAVARIDERIFFARGWMRDDQAPIARLDAVSPEGSRVPLLDRAFSVPRPDLDEMFRNAPEPVPKPGFVCFFDLPAPSRLAEGWVFELENTAGVGVEADSPPVVTEPLAVRDTVLGELARERRFDTPLMDQLAPPVVRLQERLAGRVGIAEIEEFGAIPEAPEASVVVPLYQRVDLLEHQLAQFANDPQLTVAAELIFVLDSPELGEELLSKAGELFEVYRVPFKLVILSHNGGFAVASNQGASIARGKMLLLMNSDVIPSGPGWLEQLVAAYESLPEAGAVAPKLLYDDESIQHAGMEFRPHPVMGGRHLAHAFKGLHRDFPDANSRRAAPALSGACLLTELELYRELDGLSTDYVKGGYEDADLCMRIHERGLETWYVPEVELYHLEGRSYVPSQTDMSNRFNAWLFNQRWGERVDSMGEGQ